MDRPEGKTGSMPRWVARFADPTSTLLGSAITQRRERLRLESASDVEKRDTTRHGVKQAGA